MVCLGQEIERALLASAAASSNITFFEHHLATDLVIEEVEGVKHCFGVDVLDQHAKAMTRFVAPVTLLATGGAGQVGVIFESHILVERSTRGTIPTSLILIKMRVVLLSTEIAIQIGLFQGKNPLPNYRSAKIAIYLITFHLMVSIFHRLLETRSIHLRLRSFATL